MRKVWVVSLVTVAIIGVGGLFGAGGLLIYLARGALVFPQWAANVESSTSMEDVEIHLTTVRMVNGKPVPATINGQRREALLLIPRAYIDWKPYLDGSPTGKVRIHATLPDLVPHAISKYVVDGSRTKGNRPRSAKIDNGNRLHMRWVSIDIGLYGLSKGLCETECSDQEHRRRAFEGRLKNYEKKFGGSAIPGLVHYVGEADIFVPNDSGEDYTFIICKVASPLYHWCNVSTLLNENMFLRYQFEKEYLPQWEEIDVKVRALVGRFLVSHNLYDEDT